MATDIWYTIKKNRYKSACIKGFSLDGDRLCPDVNEHEHSLFLKALDGVDHGAGWGRISCDFTVSEDVVLYIYAAASDETEIVYGKGQTVRIEDVLTDPAREKGEKLRLLEQMGAKRAVNTRELLLYELKGRYLYLALVVEGSGCKAVESFRVSSRGDNFMDAFPEIYRERNSFLHRYLSIFSTIYNDIGADGEGLYHLLDIDHCPASLLEKYASWFGIDLRGGFLNEDTMRKIVREAYFLNRMKGTRKALERIMELVLGERVIIIENGVIRERAEENGSKGEFKADDNEITVLVNKRLTEETRHQLMWILDQFKPLRTRVRLTQLQADAVMDGSSYLDMNAAIPEETSPVLDEQILYDGVLTLR